MKADVQSSGAWMLAGLAVLAAAAAGVLHWGYFQLAPWIWSQSQPVRLEELAIWQLPWMNDRDGIELYALYGLMFADLLLVWMLDAIWQRFSGGGALYCLVLPLVLACAWLYIVGFHPPMSTWAGSPLADTALRAGAILIVIVPLAAILQYLRATAWGWAVAALLLVPVCFIATAPIAWYDYSFMLAPALRLLHGAGVSEVYLPYDLWLSLLGAAWMKLQLNINSFQVLGQASYYLLSLGIYALARQWFSDKRLPVLLLIALVLARIYAGPGDAVHSFQLTPLRLDLWAILLALVYFKGPYHWSAGLYCGVLLVLHKNFGIIYSAAYLQLIVTLSLLQAEWRAGAVLQSVLKVLARLFKDGYLNVVLMLAGALVSYWLFHKADENSEMAFASLGISFTKIMANSFYWYVVVVVGMVFALLLRLRTVISGNYLAAGLGLVYLAIGNSLYFFGRSHENNLINIAAILVLLFFLLLDLCGRSLANVAGARIATTHFGGHRNWPVMAAWMFIAMLAVWYGDSIAGKVRTQAQNAAQGQFIFPSEVPEQEIFNTLAEVKAVTGNSPRVYFIGDNDFLLNYYGGYASAGYYNPVYAWISKREFNKFLQGLVDQGYYLVIDDGLVQEVLPFIRVSRTERIQGALVVW